MREDGGSEEGGSGEGEEEEAEGAGLSLAGFTFDLVFRLDAERGRKSPEVEGNGKSAFWALAWGLECSLEELPGVEADTSGRLFLLLPALLLPSVEETECLRELGSDRSRQTRSPRSAILACE